MPKVPARTPCLNAPWRFGFPSLAKLGMRPKALRRARPSGRQSKTVWPSRFRVTSVRRKACECAASRFFRVRGSSAYRGPMQNWNESHLYGDSGPTAAHAFEINAGNSGPVFPYWHAKSPRNQASEKQRWGWGGCRKCSRSSAGPRSWAWRPDPRPDPSIGSAIVKSRKTGTGCFQIRMAPM